MRSRTLLAAWLASSLVLLAGPAVTPASAAPALPAATKSCAGVWVVVDRGNGDATTRCATKYRTGLQALTSAGFSISHDAGYVLRIHGYPASPDPHSFTAYWSYWHASAKADQSFSGWQYSSVGAAASHPAKGSVEGWRFGGGGSIAPRQLPPRGYALAPQPKITGKAKKARILRVKAGTWRPSPSRFTLRWYRNGKAIKGATKTTYKLTTRDIGKRITVKVVASGTGLQTLTKMSKKTKKVTR